MHRILAGVPAVIAVVGLARASHAAPTVAVTALASAVAVRSGRDAVGCVLVGLAVLTGQLSIGWLNDLRDVDGDRAAGRLDKPLVTSDLSPAVVRGAFVVAAASCVPLSLASGWRAGTCHLLAVAGGWAYDLGLKRTVLSFVPYALSFALLASFLALGLPGHPAPAWWLLAAGALLGVGAHFLNVVPDIDADVRAGVLGLPQRLGGAVAGAGGAVLLALAAAVVTFGPDGSAAPWSVGGLGVAVVLAVGAAVAGRRTTSRLPFLLALATAVVTVLLLIGSGARIG